MVLAMKAIKAVNPKISTYFYMNSHKDHPEMTHMARELMLINHYVQLIYLYI